MAITRCSEFSLSSDCFVSEGKISLISKIDGFLGNAEDDLSKSVSKLPVELRNWIAAYMLRLFSAALLLSSPINTMRYTVSLLQPVWAVYIRFRGKYYNFSLRNEEVESTKSQRCYLVYSPPSNTATTAIYVAHDPWGLRRVVFAPQSATLSAAEEAGLWWSRELVTCQSEQGQAVQLQCETDVSGHSCALRCYSDKK